MGKYVAADIATAIAQAMEESGSKIIELDPIVAKVQKLHPQLDKNEIAQEVMSLVSARGGAVVWPGKGGT